MAADFAGSSAPYTPRTPADFDGTTGGPPPPPPPPDETPEGRLRLSLGMTWSAGQRRAAAVALIVSAPAPRGAEHRIAWSTANPHTKPSAAPWHVAAQQQKIPLYTPEQPGAVSLELSPAQAQGGYTPPSPADFAGTSDPYTPPSPADFSTLSAPPIGLGVAVDWLDHPDPGSYSHDTETAIHWGAGTAADTAAVMAWGAGTPADRAVAALWGAGTPADQRIALTWDAGTPADRRIALTWDAAAERSVSAAAPWRSSFQAVESVGAEPYAPEQASAAHLSLRPRGYTPPAPADFAGSSEAYTPPTPADFAGADAFGEGINVDWPQIATAPPAPGTRNADRPFRLVWGEGQARARQPALAWITEDPGPGDGLPATVPTKESYTVESSLNVVRLPERTPINVIGARASLALGDFAWRASIALADQSGLDLLNPSTGRKEAEIEINGFAVWVIAESWTRQTVFGKEAWVVQCRGISAELDRPYSAPRSFLSTSTATASQLSLDELSGTGWTRTWSAVDWTLAAGQFHYADRTPIRAIAGLAGAPGAFVRPDANIKHLTIMSQLPHKPEDWSTQTPDAIIPQAITTKLSDHWRPAPEYNYVQVSGGTQGVLVKATKQGTNGDKPRADIVDPHITSSGVGQERGRVEIYSSGNAAEVGRQMPIIAGLGVRLPGELVRNDDLAGQWFGLVKSVGIAGAWGSNGLSSWMDLSQDRRDL